MDEIVEPLPCPFCGKKPKVLPSNPALDGNAWAAVQCVNKKCPAQPRVKDGALASDDRGSDACKALAVRRWNHRSDLRQAAGEREAEVLRLRTAISWALGESPDGAPAFEPRAEGQPPYWWRKQLRALSSPPQEHGDDRE